MYIRIYLKKFVKTYIPVILDGMYHRSCTTWDWRGWPGATWDTISTAHASATAVTSHHAVNRKIEEEGPAGWPAGLKYHWGHGEHDQCTGVFGKYQKPTGTRWMCWVFDHHSSTIEKDPIWLFDINCHDAKSCSHAPDAGKLLKFSCYICRGNNEVEVQKPVNLLHEGV